MPTTSRQNKYNVSPAAFRQWRGKVYDSKAEMEYAQELFFLLEEAGFITLIIEQPRTTLGCPENVYRPDFFVIEKGGKEFFVDVKGAYTAEFKRNVKLWREYGLRPLHIVKKNRKRKFTTVQVVG